MKLVPSNHPALTQIAQPFPQGRPVEHIAKEMFEIMRQGKGLGLAANQVGLLGRIIVVQCGSFKQVIVNPVITKRSIAEQHFKGGEGCLSFPGLRVPIDRHAGIVVEGFNALWKPVRFKLAGDKAVVVQHEIDHLNGITINSLRS